MSENPEHRETRSGDLRGLFREVIQHQELEDVPNSSNFESEDFLFHLYRGGELLQDNCVAEAREELERAFKLKPQDLEGQGLLGIVYFRLGMYPRAIEIYRDMVRLCPKEPTPGINLALCFLKTGQPHQARESLERVIATSRNHKRAWGYLGLAFQQLGDLAKAQAAFERAEQPHMARRMQSLLEGPSSIRSKTPVPEHEALQEAAAAMVNRFDASDAEGADDGDLFSSAPPALLEPGPLPWSTREPGRPDDASRLLEPSLPETGKVASGATITPPAFADWFASTLIALADTTEVVQDPRWMALRINGFAVRSDSLIALVPERGPLQGEPLHRRMRGARILEQFGAPHAGLSELVGTGCLVLRRVRERHVSVVEISDKPVYFRETSILGFDSSVCYENGRLSFGGSDIAMVQFSGKGRVLVESEGAPISINVVPQIAVAVRSSDLLGWVGRLLVTPLENIDSPDGSSSFSSLSGEGLALLDVHASQRPPIHAAHR